MYMTPFYFYVIKDKYLTEWEANFDLLFVKI